jgi:hypothetical protein
LYILGGGKIVSNINSKLKQQRFDEDICGVLLMVNGKITRAHGCILAAASEYFKVMLSVDCKEKQELKVNFSEWFGSISTLENIIDFIYGEELIVTEDLLFEYVRAADVFMIPEL